MRRQLFGILFLISLLIPTLGFAAQGVHVAMATNNLGTSYTTSFPQLALTLVNQTTKHVHVANTGTSAVAITFTNSTAAVAPSSSTTTNPLQIFVAPGSSATFLYLGAAKYVWARADVTGMTAGDLVIDVW